MEVDLFQLPIPDWGLKCSGCDYPLRGLPSHRCPECGIDLDIPAMVQPWHKLRRPRFTGRELPFPDFGLSCKTCGAELAGAATHACTHCGAAFDPESLLPKRSWRKLDVALRQGVPLPIIENLLREAYIPHRVEQDTTFPGVLGRGHFEGGQQLLIAREFYFDYLNLIERAKSEAESARESADRKGWPCPQCGSENPLHFEACWECGSSST